MSCEEFQKNFVLRLNAKLGDFLRLSYGYKRRWRAKVGQIMQLSIGCKDIRSKVRILERVLLSVGPSSPCWNHLTNTSEK